MKDDASVSPETAISSQYAITLRIDFAHDPGGIVAAVELSLDGNTWRPVDPRDGVADSEKESYRRVLDSADDPVAFVFALTASRSPGHSGTVNMSPPRLPEA